MVLQRAQIFREVSINALSLVLILIPFFAVQAQSTRARSVVEQKQPVKTIVPQQPVQKPVPKTPPVPEKKQVEEDTGPLLKIESKLVAVPVSVTDSQGEPIKGLKPEDFRLEEEGSQQQLVALGEPGQSPVELSLLFDVSGSVFEKFKFQQEAAARFLKQVLKPKDAASVFVIGMSSRLAQERSTNIEKVLDGVKNVLPTKEGTAFFDTVADAAKYIGKTAEPGTRHVIVVISDGEDNKSDRYHLPEALQELQRNDCLFYSINPSGPSIWLNRVSQKGHDGMVALARQTGGSAFLPNKFEDLDAVFRQIATELQAQYLLGYYSTDDRSDGGFRKIAVNVPKRPELRVRARQGYYAPKSS